MTRWPGGQKRRQWEERFDRYRTDGLTVARFCANERVSVNTFYYWAKRMGLRSTRARSTQRDVASERHHEPVCHGHVSAANTALVHFRLGAAVEVSVPAHCVDAIRCLAECIQQSRREHSDVFREVVVGPR
jgi:hypothetical protein